MKRIYRILRRALLPVLLGVLLLLGAVAPAFAGENLPENALHFGLPGMGPYASISGAELLGELCGVTPTEAERAFLEGEDRFTFFYSSTIPSEGLSYHYDGEEGKLSLSVRPFTYTAVNGETVSWIPETATIRLADEGEGDGEDCALLLDENGTYSCLFTELYHSADFSVEVDFSCQVTIPEETLTELSNAAYEEGSAALQTLLAYEAALDAYEEQVASAETYAAYLRQVEDYAAYELALDEYEKAKAAYDAYCVEYAAYADQLSRWQAWRDYYAANAFYTQKDAEGKTGYDRYLEYQSFLQALEPIKQKLAFFDYMFISDSHGWQIYGSVMGDSVTQVLNRKEELGILNLDEAVDQAANATNALRPLFSAYHELHAATYPSELERYRTLYAYYTENYIAMRDAVASLQSALELICTDSGFLTALEIYPDPTYRGHLPRLQNLIAQLYVMRTCLHDGLAQNEDWQLNKYRTLKTLLEEVHRMEDTHDADPSTAIFPENCPEAVEFVPQAEKPSFPDVQKPTEPSPVAEPTAPAVVEKPVDYGAQKPSWWGAEMPAASPTAPTLAETSRALAEEVRAGVLTARAPITSAQTLSFAQTQEYFISINNLMTVSFYGIDNVLLYRTQVEYGTEVIYNGPELTVPETPECSYEFRGWRCADGSAADFFRIRQNTSFYANFHAIPKYYDVTWRIGAYTYTSHHAYGETPTCPVTPNLADTPAMRYEFLGWDSEISPVTGDAIYTARFSETPVLYTVTWELGDRTETKLYGYGEMPTYKGTPARAADSYRYVFVGWDARLSEVTENVTYTALYGEILLAYTDDGLPVRVTHTEDCITVHTANGQAVRLDEAMRMALEQGKALAFANRDVTVSFSGEALEALYSSSCKKLRWSVEESALGDLLTLQLLSSAGRIVELPSLEGCILPAEDPAIRLDLAREGEWISLDPQAAQDFLGALRLRVRRSFSITVESVENCDIQSIPTSSFSGERITLDPPCVFGFEVVGVTVIGEDGQILASEGLSFVMPNERVTLRLQVEPIRYTVTFIVNGEVWTTAEYGLGEEILAPSIPSLPSDEEYRYVFTGWSPRLGVASGASRDLTYTASFSKILLSDEDPYRGDMTKSNFFTFFVPMAILFVLLLIGGILLLCFRKRIRRAWQARKADRKKIEETASATKTDPETKENE